MKFEIFSFVSKFMESMDRRRHPAREVEVQDCFGKEPLHPTNLTESSYIPNLIGNTGTIGVTALSTEPGQVACTTELEQLGQDRCFDPRKALERKAEIEARYFFLQRVRDDPARIEIMLDIYAGWVGRMSTPRGLAEFMLKDHDVGLVDGEQRLAEGVKPVKDA